MSPVTRRSLLRMAAHSLGALGAASCMGRLSRLYAASTEAADYKALVCIFLYGGNDGNNLIVPIKTDAQSYADYLRVRGTTLGLPQDGPRADAGELSADGQAAPAAQHHPAQARLT